MTTAALPEAPVEVALPPPRPELGRSGGDTGGGDEDRGGGGGGRGDGDDEIPFSGPKIALAFALIASSILFLVTLACALLLRRSAAEWPLEGAAPFPRILWANTVILLASSVALRRGGRAIDGGDEDGLARGILATTLLGIAFLLGQGRAWQEMLPVSAGANAG
ncbi:hypothetical protein HY251_22300, partial [bacterium]|nr:hypothetical protein [bacterium]